jgi:hypothetical protein
MFEKIKAFWQHVRSFEMKEDNRDNYPYGIEINGFEYYADAYVVLADHEMREYGIRWMTQNHGIYEYHGNPFTIRFNPKFQMHLRPPEDQKDFNLPYHR